MARSVGLALGGLCGLVLLILCGGSYSQAQVPTPGPTQVAPVSTPGAQPIASPTQAPGLPGGTPAPIVGEPVVVVGFAEGSMGVFYLISAVLLFGIPTICFLLLILALQSQ